MVFFDSEAETEIEITDADVDRARKNQANKKSCDPVRKYHKPYLICATFYRDRRKFSKEPIRTKAQYYPTAAEINSGQQYKFIRNFWNTVDSFATARETTYIFAHNAKYDTMVTQAIPILVGLGYRVKSYSDSNPFFVDLEKVGKSKNGKPEIINLSLLSSTNYYQQSLAKLGDIFGLPKLDFDHGQKIDMLDPEFVKQSLVYGIRDVDILETAMLSFIHFVEREGLGKFKKTVAGQTFAAFLNQFMIHDIYIHDDRIAIEVERRAYAGGRNECFQLGKIEGQVFYLDINSMYPYAMKSKLYPTKLVTVWRTASIEQMMDKIEDGFLICADVVVNTSHPMFHKKAGRLTFPIGKFETTLSTPEIILAYERGFLVSVKNVCVYEAADIFSEFVDFFYESRLEAKHAGDSVHDYLYKIFMNALYGKFGQKAVQWDVLIDDDGNEIEIDPSIIDMETIFYEDTKELITRKMFGGKIFEQNKDPDEQEAMNSFPAIAAHVTAYARCLLWSFIETAGLENVYYCDTDSVFVNSTGWQELWLNDMIDPDRLGALKIEAIADDLELFGCKDYIFKGKTKMKGVSKSARFLGENEHGQMQFAVTQWGGFNDRFKEANFTDYYNKVIIKTLKREYTKGNISDTGRVTPFVLDEEAEQKKALKEIGVVGNDYIRFLCETVGFIRTPLKGERYYEEYKNINRKYKGRYFRIETGLRLDEWCDECSIDVAYLLDYLNS
jgi:hypothetical protein